MGYLGRLLAELYTEVLEELFTELSGFLTRPFSHQLDPTSENHQQLRLSTQQEDYRGANGYRYR
jgi:hypothetical protein